jgi:hypothetical protein
MMIKHTIEMNYPSTQITAQPPLGDIPGERRLDSAGRLPAGNVPYPHPFIFTGNRLLSPREKIFRETDSNDTRCFLYASRPLKIYFKPFA